MFKNLAAILCAFSLLANPAIACNVALALTVDVSGSINDDEYRLQMDGLAAALQDSTVEDAIINSNAALMLVQWTGGSRQAVSIPWQRMNTREDVIAFAARVAQTPRQWSQFSTGIGNAMTFTAAQFGPVNDCARKVIDISGDGYSNEGSDPKLTGAKLAQLGFQINGLAIEGDAFELTEYYRFNVVNGDGAFVLTAETYADYPRAIWRKLLAELTDQISMNQ